MIDQLRSPDTHHQAAADLGQVALEELVPALVQVIRDDAEFGAKEWLRSAAYTILLDVGPGAEQGGGSYQHHQQVVQILDGLSDSGAAVRGLCLRATPRIEEGYTAELVSRVVPMLREEAPLMAAAAAQALGEMGPRAKAAMPALLDVLLAEKDEELARWQRIRVAQAEREQQAKMRAPQLPTGEVFDQELIARTGAAFARIRIGGLDVDVAAYGQLDWRGRTAAIDALRGPLVQAMSRELPGRKPRVRIDGRDLRTILAFLAGAALHEEIPLESQRTAIGLIGVTALGPPSQIDEGLRSESAEHLRTLSAHPNERARSDALYFIERLGQ